MLCNLLLSHKRESCMGASQACACAHTNACLKAADMVRVPHLRVTRAPLKSAGCPGPYLPTLVDTTTLSRGRPRSPRPSSCAPGRRNYRKPLPDLTQPPGRAAGPAARAPAAARRQGGR